MLALTKSSPSVHQGTGTRCYDDPVVGRNNGTAAFEACLCSNESQSSTNPECPAEYAEELEQLVNDVGCCVNTGVYAYYFGTCGDSPDEGTDFQANVRVLRDLFGACDVTLPAIVASILSAGHREWPLGCSHV